MNSASDSRLASARMRRALGRQGGPFIAILALALIGGVCLDLILGAPLTTSLLVSGAIGAALGLAVGLVRELGRNTVTSIASLGEHRDYPVLGAAPELSPASMRQLPPNARTPLGVLAFKPASDFASAFRDLQHRIGDEQIVAFIAASPDEGATTTALCAAASAVQQGRRTIVIDCDLRRRSLTRSLAIAPRAGIMEACDRPDAWRAYIEYEDETGLPILPAAENPNAWRTLFGSPGFRTLLDMLRSEYDLIVLDCPPVLTNAEGVMLARMADRCVFVTRWDDTPLDVLRRAMRALRTCALVKTGIYVNRVPPGYRFGRLRPD